MFPFLLPRISVILALVWGLPLICLAILPVLARAQVDLHGRVLHQTVECSDPSNPLRCNTVYLIAPSDGGAAYRYVSGYADSSILQGMKLPPGTTIDKDEWHITYWVNGHQIDDFGLGLPFVMGSSGLLLIGFGLFRAVRDGLFPNRVVPGQ